MKAQNDEPTKLKVFTMVMLFGAVASVVDGVAYLLHVRAQGVGLFSSVPWSVFWSYLTTFPGNVLTGLWLLPWIVALAWLYAGDRAAERRPGESGGG